MKWVVFDFEFTELLPPLGQPWPESLHIACASVLCTGETWPQVWYERQAVDAPMPGNFMSEATLSAFVTMLEGLVASGHRIATWGGAASDWRLLERECPSKSTEIRELALESVDIPMCSCMTIGMMMGLNAACMALGFQLKEPGASENVPQQWAVATPETRGKVLQHVSNDSYATMMVLRQAQTANQLPWITQKGLYKTWSPVQLLTVRQCLARELPPVPFEISPTHNAKLLARWLLMPPST